MKRRQVQEELETHLFFRDIDGREIRIRDGLALPSAAAGFAQTGRADEATYSLESASHRRLPRVPATRPMPCPRSDAALHGSPTRPPVPTHAQRPDVANGRFVISPVFLDAYQSRNRGRAQLTPTASMADRWRRPAYIKNELASKTSAGPPENTLLANVAWSGRGIIQSPKSESRRSRTASTTEWQAAVDNTFNSPSGRFTEIVSTGRPGALVRHQADARPLPAAVGRTIQSCLRNIFH